MSSDPQIDQKFHCETSYKTVFPLPKKKHLFPTPLFYAKLLAGPMRWLCVMARKGKCDDVCWAHGSRWFADLVEEMGAQIIVEGLEHLRSVQKPCVIVANHMSTLETFVLPAIVRPVTPVTFVVKKSLVSLPFFGAVMRSRNPVVVGRTNPREDLTHVLTEGVQRLKDGISLIIFPQSSRMADFDPKQFNSIGEKLAKKACVPLLPLALKTDAWAAGSVIKEIAQFRPERPIHFRFAEAMMVTGNSKAIHESLITFIMNSLSEWKKNDTHC
ncbi:MAG: 1-acyl-sn-glycerol-3-phosphate acyltransferase [Desulfovibrionaceae bacterium]|nr:1-acyl-sn-glycerol-3-phosphate acyltransferase [Desulfovibrionaceae bacterium]